MAETVGLKLDIDGQGASKTVKDLKTEIKNLNSEMLNVKEGSSAYQSLAQRAGEAKERIKDLHQATNLFTRGGTISEIANVGQTIAGGFAAAQGAMALFGGATEDVQRQLLKVQAGIAIVEGIKSAIAGWESVQRLLNVAMAANPIGLLITGVVALTGLIGGLVASMNSAVGKSNDHYDAMVKQEKASQELLKSFDLEERRLRALGVAEDVIIGKRKEVIKQMLQQAVLTQQAAQQVAKENEKSLEKSKQIGAFFSIGGYGGIDKALQFFGISSSQEDVDKAVEKVRESTEKVKEFQVEILELDKKKNETIKKREIKVFDHSSENAAIQELEKTLKAQKDLKDKADEQELNDFISQTDKILAATNARNAARAAEEIRQAKALEDAKYAIAEAGASALGSLAALAEQGSAASKAAALAQIAVGTGVGFIQALDIAQKSAKLAGPGAALAFPVFYASQIAAVLAAASRAKSIIGAGGSIPSAPSLGGSQSRPPQLNNVSAGVTSLSTDQNGDYNGTQKTQVIKAYVVESDLTSSQKNIASIVKKSKIE